MLKSHACDAMTGAAGDYAGWCEEAKGGNGVRRLGASRRLADNETSRNMCMGRKAVLSCASLVDIYEMPVSRGTCLWGTIWRDW